MEHPNVQTGTAPPGSTTLGATGKALGITMVVILCALLVFTIWRGNSISERLKRKGWTLVLKSGSPKGTQQLSVLDSLLYEPTVVCGAQSRVPELDSRRHVSARRKQKVCAALPASQTFPLWVNVRTGEARTGLQDNEQLEAMAA